VLGQRRQLDLFSVLFTQQLQLTSSMSQGAARLRLQWHLSLRILGLPSWSAGVSVSQFFKACLSFKARQFATS
jgi:hypothetical protein